jgi:solute carrier family 35 protein E1
VGGWRARPARRSARPTSPRRARAPSRAHAARRLLARPDLCARARSAAAARRRAQVSKAKWLALIPVIGGVCLASAKELDFAWSALITAMLANVMAAFRANENKRLMDTPGLRERIGSVGNQFALTMILSSALMLPIWAVTEASKWGAFCTAFKSSPALKVNLITSGLFFYIYNELSTLTIKKTSATTQSVANTAKRVIVIVGVALVLKESLDPIKLLGCAIGIGGVFLYSVRAPCALVVIC